jgi:hypothetical protein
MFARLICWARGHKRGKLHRVEPHGEPAQINLTKVFRCPRCKRETRYKMKGDTV